MYLSNIGEPLSPDCLFDFPVDEPEPHPAYDFFALGPLPGYAGNPNNNNGWIEADVSLLGELRDVANEPMVGPLDDENAEPIVEAEEQVIALVIDMDEDIAMLFGDDDFEVGGPSTDAAEGQSFPLPASRLPLPSSMIEDSSTRLGNMEYEHRQLVKKVIQVSNVEVADDITIGEIGPRVFAIEGEVQVMASQMVQAEDRLEQVQALQAAVQQRDSQIQQL
uniref:Uncharacterized protein n=1 Tax=Tanacetum cinerariifolium TaxID=118510 RepID=A0A6L2LIQ1_TANCI|nr:hypothetical protein [Tanacetum cinerariifolium]